MKRKLICIILSLTLSIGIIGCSTKNDSSTKDSSITATSTSVKKINLSSTVKEEDLTIPSVNEANATISLGETISIDGDGAKVQGNDVVITKAGVYNVTGTLDNGQIIIDAGEDDKVEILLNRVNITCTDSAAIYEKNSKKTLITLVEGTENILNDDNDTFSSEDTESSSDEDDSNGTIYCKDDLTIKGTGSLTVNGNSNNGIVSKDDIRITGGTINVKAVNNGIKGKDSVEIYDGKLNIVSEGDGIKSNNSSKDTKGYVLIDNGEIDIESKNDGIQADNSVLVLDGEINITSGEGSENVEPHVDNDFRGGMNFNTNTTNEEDTSNEEESESTKGIKAENSLIIKNGKININACDDAIHSNSFVEIDNGNIEIASGSHGIHADAQADINDGTINITESYEGIEAAVINMNGGNTSIVASDDGINASDGTTQTMGGPGGGGDFQGGGDRQNPPSDSNGDMSNPPDGTNSGDNQGTPPNNGNVNQGNPPSNGEGRQGNPPDNNVQGNMEMPSNNENSNAENTSSSTIDLNINGGYLYVNANGDGLDSNGTITVNGGTTVVYGPTSDGDTALDYETSLNINGGTLLAAGSSGMLELPSDSSKQNVIVGYLNKKDADTVVNITDSDGNTIFTFAPKKEYASFIFSSSELNTNSSYNISIGGTVEGEENNGVYENSKYSGGDSSLETKIFSSVTSVVEEGASTTRSAGPGGNNNMQENQMDKNDNKNSKESTDL